MNCIKGFLISILSVSALAISALSAIITQAAFAAQATIKPQTTTESPAPSAVLVTPECASVDNAIANAANGMVTPIPGLGMNPSATVAFTILCQIEKSPFKDGMCETRIGLRKDLLLYVEDSFKVGEVSGEDVQAAKTSYAQTVVACIK